MRYKRTNRQQPYKQIHTQTNKHTHTHSTTPGTHAPCWVIFDGVGHVYLRRAAHLPGWSLIKGPPASSPRGRPSPPVSLIWKIWSGLPHWDSELVTEQPRPPGGLCARADVPARLWLPRRSALPRLGHRLASEQRRVAAGRTSLSLMTPAQMPALPPLTGRWCGATPLVRHADEYPINQIDQPRFRAIHLGWPLAVAGARQMTSGSPERKGGVGPDLPTLSRQSHGRRRLLTDYYPVVTTCCAVTEASQCQSHYSWSLTHTNWFTISSRSYLVKP